MKKILFFMAFMFMGFCSWTEENSKKILSVEDAVALAKENNVSIAREKITLDAAKRDKDHSWNSVSPTASVGSGVTLPTDDSNYDYSYNVNASVSLSLSTNLYTSMNGAKIAYESGKLTFEQAVKSVDLSVREAFYGLLYEKENITLQEENLQIAKTQYDNNLAKYNQGRLSEIDVLSAEVNYKSIVPTLESAKIAYLNDLDSFKQALGLEHQTEIELVGSLDEMINLNEIRIKMEDVNSAELKALEYSLESAKNSVLDKRFSAFAPSLSASWSWRDTWTEPDSSGTNPVNSSSLTLSASIPLDGILPWSVRNDAIDTAKDSVKDLELQIDNAKKDLTRSVHSSIRSIKQSQESIKYKQANVSLAQKTYEMTLEAYNRGTKDLLTLQDANASLLNAEVSLKSETLNLIKMILEFENTVGVPFGTFGK